jgi:hypothetical protein
MKVFLKNHHPSVGQELFPDDSQSSAGLVASPH